MAGSCACIKKSLLRQHADCSCVTFSWCKMGLVILSRCKRAPWAQSCKLFHWHLNHQMNPCICTCINRCALYRLGGWIVIEHTQKYGRCGAAMCDITSDDPIDAPSGEYVPGVPLSPYWRQPEKTRPGSAHGGKKKTWLHWMKAQSCCWPCSVPSLVSYY